MSRRFIVGGLLGLGLGLLVALSTGTRRQVSVEVWVVFVAAWLIWLMARDLLSVAPLAPERLRGLVAWRRDRPPSGPRPRPLTLLEGLVLSARDNERAMALRLRPRLGPLAAHFLATRHGIDAEAEPERAAAVLGELVPLVDLDAEPQKLVLSDLDRLLDMVLGPDEHGSGAAGAGPSAPGSGEGDHD